jgi:flagellar biosynthesis protein FliP
VADDVVVDESTNRWAATGRLLRWLLGAFSLVGGLSWILVTTPNLTDVVVGVVLAAAGLVLLMPHRIQLPRRLTALVMAGFAVVGTVAGLVVLIERFGSFAYAADRGWPFQWIQRYAVADDPASARSLADSANWTVDLVSLVANLVLWAYAGLLLVVIGVLVRRARGDQPVPPA